MLPKVYIAGPWSMKDKLKITKHLLEEKGFEVTSRWIDLHVEKPQTPEEAGWAEATAHIMHDEAYNDFDDVVESDVLLLFNVQPRGSETSGKAVETGIALAHHIPVILIGDRTNVFHYMDEVRQVDGIGPALDELYALTRQAGMRDWNLQ